MLIGERCWRKPLTRNGCGDRTLGINLVSVSLGPGSLLRLFGVQVLDFFLFAVHWRFSSDLVGMKSLMRHLQVVSFGTLRWPEGDTPCFWEARFIDRQTEGGWGNKETCPWSCCLVCPSIRSSYEVSQVKADFFPTYQDLQMLSFSYSKSF